MDVRHGQRGQPFVAALVDGTALVLGRIQLLRAALAGGAEPVEEGADVLGGEPGELLGAEAGLEVETDAGGVAGVGVLPQPVDGDAAQPVREVDADRAVGGGDGKSAVAVGDLLGEFVGGVLAGGAVDADALASGVGGEDVASCFPTAISSLVDGAFAVRAGLPLRGVIGWLLPGGAGCSRRARGWGCGGRGRWSVRPGSGCARGRRGRSGRS